MATSIGQNAHKSPTASTAREAMRGQRVIRRMIMVFKNRKTELESMVMTTGADTLQIGAQKHCTVDPARQ